jgi:hypothetical protein
MPEQNINISLETTSMGTEYVKRLEYEFEKIVHVGNDYKNSTWQVTNQLRAAR